MKCESCKKKPATVHFKEAFNGQVREMHLCDECAAKSGLAAKVPVSLADFLFGVEVRKDPDPAPDRSCPACHMRHSDFVKTSRLGCPACYETFRDDLKPLLADVQRGMRHAGKVPAKARLASAVRLVRRKLAGAVAAEQFEEAARLRDRLAEMERKHDPLAPLSRVEATRDTPAGEDAGATR
jgi:protein arginine kinase activator